MANNTANNTDDFFSLLAKDEAKGPALSSDEILFRDEQGKLKVLRQGEVLDYSFSAGKKFAPRQEQPKVQAASTPAEKVLPSLVAEKPRISTLPTGWPLKIDQEIEKITKKSAINFSSPEMANRFKSIVISRLRDIRDKLEIREILLKPVADGGMGFDEAMAGRVLAIIEQEFNWLSDGLRQKVSQEFPSLRAEAEKILAEPLSAKPPVKKEPIPGPVVEPKLKMPVEEPPKAPPAKLEAPGPKVFQKAAADIIAKPEPPVKKAPEPIKVPAPRPEIKGVKFKPRLIDPIKEIKTMKLIDFRRLASTPLQAIEKILEKIELLEKESFTKKIQAIKAWQENEIYQLYLDLGGQSMKEKKPILDVIAERQAAGQPTLSEEELDVVIELNRRIRY